MTTEEFIKSKGNYFHLRLLKYFESYSTEEERQKMEPNYTLFFDFEEGRFAIEYSKLIEEAQKDMELLKDNTKPKIIALTTFIID
jgi:hypothetical protein